jgi:hypothetical protein
LIRLRAIAQIGKLSRELEKAQGARTELGLTNETKLKQLEAAGISKATANRYEQLASPSAQAAPAVEAAMENRTKDSSQR